MPRLPRLPRAVKRGFYWSSVAAIWGLIAVAGLLIYYAASLPPISDLKVPDRAPNVVILASDGAQIGSRGVGYGADLRIEQLPAYLPQAVIAIEDRRFRSHFGVDIYGLARAMYANAMAGRIVQGGSTLTQQLAKNLFLKPERTIRRKMQEIVLALWLEANYSKDQILETYLNRVYFGAGTYGVEAAAQRFFNKSARFVTLSEAAVLAGLLKAPSRYAPHRNPDRAEERAFLVLNNMVEEGFISIADGQMAVDNPATLVRRTRMTGVNYVADWVSDVLPDYVGQVERDITVTTTIDPALQQAAERAVRDVLEEEGEAMGVEQGALVAIDGGGAIRALIGGRSYAQSQFNRAVRAKRQPGSAFKPFVYLTALERGLTPDTVRSDAPIRIGGWEPKNYSDKFRGEITLRDALAYSINTVAARLIQEVKPRRVVETARRLGITAELHRDATLALGTAEVTPLEMTAAFVPFSNGGYGVIPYVIDTIRTAEGELLYRRAGSGPGRVVAPLQVGEMNDMLSKTIRSGTGRRADFGWPAAGKTGTSQEFRDAWFVGYTARLTAGVWVGNDDGSSTKRVTGGSLPAMIWYRFMTAAHQGLTVADLPGRPSLDPAPPGPQITVPDGFGPPIARVGRDPSEPLAPATEVSAPGLNGGFWKRIFGG